MLCRAGVVSSRCRNRPPPAVPPDPAARLATPPPNKGRTAAGPNDGFASQAQVQWPRPHNTLCPARRRKPLSLVQTAVVQWCSGAHCSAVSGSAAPCNSAALQLSHCSKPTAANPLQITHCSHMTGSFVMFYPFVVPTSMSGDSGERLLRLLKSSSSSGSGLTNCNAVVTLC